MIDPSILGDLPDMLQIALMCCDKPPKAIARDIKCSVSAIYEATKGTRHIPVRSMQEFTKTNLIAAASMAMQATGLKCIFGYRKGDRHIQSRIVELKVYDKRADQAMNDLPELLFNKNSRDDLTSDDFITLTAMVAQLVERDNVSFNLLMELDIKYKMDLVESLQKGRKKETACVRTHTISGTL